MQAKNQVYCWYQHTIVDQPNIISPLFSILSRVALFHPQRRPQIYNYKDHHHNFTDIYLTHRRGASHLHNESRSEPRAVAITRLFQGIPKQTFYQSLVGGGITICWITNRPTSNQLAMIGHHNKLIWGLNPQVVLATIVVEGCRTEGWTCLRWVSIILLDYIGEWLLFAFVLILMNVNDNVCRGGSWLMHNIIISCTN